MCPGYRCPMRHVFQCQLRWHDLDAQQHINNVAFVAYMQEARVDFLFTRKGQAGGLANGVVVAQQQIEYLAPLDWRPEPIAVETWVTHIGGASFTLSYEIKDATTVYAKASTVMVAFDLATAAPRRLTDAERQLLAGYQG